MTEHSDQTTAQPSAVPARIALEDFIEAVTRGVTRALATQDEVSGYMQLPGADQPLARTPVIIMQGIFPPPATPFPGRPDLSDSQATTLERR